MVRLLKTILLQLTESLSDEFATPEAKRQKKNRMKMLRIVSILAPSGCTTSPLR